MRVAVLGASQNPERYSNKAMHALARAGHEVVPINPAQKIIDGIAVTANLAAIVGPIDTITVYVNPSLIDAMVADILRVKPRRVIFNPGAESTSAEKSLRDAGIDVIEACTLVMLSTGQF